MNPLALLVSTSLLVPSLLALWWQARRRFERHVVTLRQQLARQRAATGEFLDDARSQIDLLQCELAEARRREDRLRARHAARARSTVAASRAAAPASTLLMIRRGAIGETPCVDTQRTTTPSSLPARRMCRQDARNAHAACTQQLDHRMQGHAVPHPEEDAA